MATEYSVQLSVVLTPRINVTVPEIKVSVPGQIRSMALSQTQTLNFDFTASEGWLCVDFTNKVYQESTATADMAVIVSSVSFFGITDPKFAWAGVYHPCYPEPWHSQQHPKPPPALPQQTYLGWNGQWRLDFSLPIFSWMHQTLSLGWLYC